MDFVPFTFSKRYTEWHFLMKKNHSPFRVFRDLTYFLIPSALVRDEGLRHRRGEYDVLCYFVEEHI